MERKIWCILTGEYPPQPGGVSDYTRLVATRLAMEGDEVHVWAPPGPDALVQDVGVVVHQLTDHFGKKSCLMLDRQLSEIPNRRLLVQYVPHAYGFRAMNLAFCLWLLRRGRRDQIWSLFHEVALGLSWRQPLRHNILGVINRLMAWCVTRASERIFVTIPSWADVLRPFVPKRRAVEWLPVPSTLPTQVVSSEVEDVRTGVLGSKSDCQTTIIGHFGTYGSMVSNLLADVLPPLLSDSGRQGMLIGRGSREFAQDLIRRHAFLAGRLTATGGLEATQVATHLAACDIVVQPYPDGISCRRTSAMASLALGVALVTNAGHLSEPMWMECSAVAVAKGPTAAEIIAEARRLLSDQDLRRALAARGKSLYQEHFDVGRIVAILRGRSSI